MKTSQCELVLNHLNEHGSITSLEAMNEYGIMRLASRISDLKRTGVKIHSKTIAGVSRRGEKIHYSQYSLIK